MTNIFDKSNISRDAVFIGFASYGAGSNEVFLRKNVIAQDIRQTYNIDTELHITIFLIINFLPKKQ